MIFSRPISGNVKWRDVVSLVRVLGGDVDESREGSRVAFLLNNNAIIQHLPHPLPSMDKVAVASLRKFLIDCEVKP